MMLEMVDSSTDLDTIHCEAPKLVKALFESDDDCFYDERRGNYDVRLKIRDEGVIQSLLKHL
jgi:hypothetical protein